jgi:tetratricopeptide (TPR) repeat protein
MKRVTPLQVFTLLILLFVITIQKVYAQGDANMTPEQCKDLFNKAIKKNNDGKYSEALAILIKLEDVAKKNKWYDKLFLINNTIGVTYTNLSNYGEALGYYKRSLEIAETHKKSSQLSTVISNIGLLYANEKDYRTALNYYLKAYSVANSNKYDYSIVSTAINISDCYNKLGDFIEARKYLDEVQKIDKSKDLEYYWRVNYTESYLIEGKLKLADDNLQVLSKEVDSNKYRPIYKYVIELLSKLCILQGDAENAVFYAKKGLSYTSELKDRLELYQQLTKIYYKKKDIENYKLYNDSILLTKDSLNSKINRGLFESNKVKLKVQEYQNEVKVNNARHSAERNVFVLGILFCLVVFFLIYKNQKNKIIKQKQEGVIAENREKILNLEMESLKNNIAEKNRKLSAKALYLSGRNELISGVITALSQIPEIIQSKNVSDYIKTLKGYLKTDTEWDDFINYFGEVNPEFLRTLTIKYPDLTSADVRFLCYIYMHLDIKEISTIFSITTEACKKRKQRIAKKMNVDSEFLHEFVLKLT